MRQEINSLGLYASATINTMPAANGISLYCGAGAPTDEFFDRGKEHELYVTVNAKNAAWSDALNALDAIHRHLTRLKSYPSGADYKILNISTGTAPNYIGPDSSGKQELYGSILKIKFYQTGVN